MLLFLMIYPLHTSLSFDVSDQPTRPMTKAAVPPRRRATSWAEPSMVQMATNTPMMARVAKAFDAIFLIVYMFVVFCWLVVSRNAGGLGKSPRSPSVSSRARVESGADALPYGLHLALPVARLASDVYLLQVAFLVPVPEG